MFIKTQEGNLVLSNHYKIISVVTGGGSAEIKMDNVILGSYQNRKCADLVMGKIEDAITNENRLMKMPTMEDVSRWSEL